MTEPEMRELDAFCAEFVMGYTRTEHPDDWTEGDATLLWHRKSSDTKTEVVLVGTAYTVKHARPPKTYDHSWTKLSPTEDSADALAVWKACLKFAGESDLRLEQWRDGDWFCLKVQGSTDLITAPTLELAICLFAKQLFTK